MRAPMRARRGITLFEAVVAIAIVGITAISALAAVGAEMRTAERARRALVVSALATERTAFLYLMTDRDLLNLPDSIAEGTFEYPMDEYSWTTTSTPHSDYAGLYTTKVTILWKEGSEKGEYITNGAQYRTPPVVTSAVRR
jgi:type II secretory pathway pseudopilin PulG